MRSIAASVAVLVCLALAACASQVVDSSSELDAAGGEEPLVRGPIETIDHHATASGLLVRAGPGSREACGISATADARTRVLERAGAGEARPISIGALAVGDTVEVYVDGPVAESCPVQGRAGLLVRVGLAAP